MSGFAIPDGLFQADDDETGPEDGRVDAVLFALADPDCRCILAATADHARTASELAEECGVPSSTMYRKLDVLSDTDLLAERVRVQRDGKHSKEYVRTADAVTIHVDGGRPFEVDVAPE